MNEGPAPAAVICQASGDETWILSAADEGGRDMLAQFAEEVPAERRLADFRLRVLETDLQRLKRMGERRPGGLLLDVRPCDFVVKVGEAVYVLADRDGVAEPLAIHPPQRLGRGVQLALGDEVRGRFRLSFSRPVAIWLAKALEKAAENGDENT